MEGPEALRFPVELVVALGSIRAFARMRHGTFVDRRINRRSTRKLLLGAEELWRAIERLQPADYHDGPSSDHHHSTREVWIFGPMVGGKRFYLKVSPPPEGDPAGTGVIVWSCHPARFDMRLPYR
jgi:hypothetical protein